jgi:hypothetical protein
VEEGQTTPPDPEEGSSEPERSDASLEATPDQATEAAPVEETTAATAEAVPEREEAVTPGETVRAIEQAEEEAAAPDTTALSQRIAETPAPPQADTTGLGGWEYYLQDGRGPYADIQKAMDAMGMDQEERPHHNRWDRLSTSLKNQIPRRAKA